GTAGQALAMSAGSIGGAYGILDVVQPPIVNSAISRQRDAHNPVFVLRDDFWLCIFQGLDFRPQRGGLGIQRFGLLGVVTGRLDFGGSALISPSGLVLAVPIPADAGSDGQQAGSNGQGAPVGADRGPDDGDHAILTMPR